MAVVSIVIPSYRGVSQEAQGPLIGMMQETNCMCRGPHGERLHEPWKCPNGKHLVRMTPQVYKSSVVHWARNQNVAMALYGERAEGQPQDDYLFLMDDDMVCQPHYLSRLLSYKRDIVCGICTVRNDPPKPNIRLWNPERHIFYYPVEWDWDSQKLMEIDGAGAAFMLVKRTVFDRMTQAYLNCEFELAFDMVKGVDPEALKVYWRKIAAKRQEVFNTALAEKNWNHADCWWFTFLPKIVSGDTPAGCQVGEEGEDLSFCWKAKKLGFKIYADPQVLPGHLGVYSYSIFDHRQFVEEAKKNGTFPEIEIGPNVTTLKPDIELVPA